MARGGLSPPSSKGAALGSTKKQKASSVTNEKITNGTRAALPEPSQPTASQPESPPKPKPRTKKKGSKAQQRKRTFFLDHVLRGVFVALTVYYLLVCPDDIRLENPTCRKLHDLRNALEPIIITPINLALSHPAVVPYVNAVKPHVDEAIRLTSPYVQMTRAAIQPRYIMLQRKLVPYIQPYTQSLEQGYNVRVRPFISRVEPYVLRALGHTKPYLERTSLALKQSYAKSLPYLRRAWSLAVQYWAKAQPYLIPIWEQIKEAPQWFIRRFGPRFAHLKSEYVDAQIRKIWAKIEELGGDRHTHKGPLTIAATITSIARSILPSMSETAEAVTASVPSVAFETSSPSPSAVESIIAAQTTPHSISDALDPEPEPERSPTFAEVDVEDFIASLTEGEESASSNGAITPQDPVGPSVPGEDEAAKEAKLTEVREKRRKIEARHSEWEAKVHEQGKHGLQAVIQNITAIRERAMADISSSEGDIGFLVAAFKAAGAKGVKGTEAYARKLMAGHYGGAEKVALFDRVVGKVEQRYGENATSLSNTVAQWWADVRDKVDEEAIKHLKLVEDIAGDAQADIGMDYAWLDDVTPADWKRYHDLMRTARAYGEDYKALANGTHPDSPEDPIPSALADLQNELQETLVTFVAELQRAQQAGLRLFVGKQTADSSSSSANKEPIFSILPVAEARKEFVDSPFIGRDREEVVSALHRASEAGETVRSKIHDSADTPSGKPASEMHEEIANGILDDIFSDAESLYKFGVEMLHEAHPALSKVVSGLVSSATNAVPTIPSSNLHDATRAAEKAGSSVLSSVEDGIATSVIEEAEIVVDAAEEAYNAAASSSTSYLASGVTSLSEPENAASLRREASSIQSSLQSEASASSSRAREAVAVTPAAGSLSSPSTPPGAHDAYTAQSSTVVASHEEL